MAGRCAWLLLAALLVAACGGAPGPAVSGPAEVAFTVHGSTSQSSRADGAGGVSAGEAARGPGDAAAPAGRFAITVFQGQQRTGGYSIAVSRVVRDGPTLEVHATFSEPGPDAIVTMALTSPAQFISVSAQDASGVTRVVLFDQAGARRAEASVN